MKRSTIIIIIILVLAIIVPVIFIAVIFSGFTSDVKNLQQVKLLLGVMSLLSMIRCRLTP